MILKNIAGSYLEAVELRAGEDVCAGLDQLGDDVEGVVDRPVVLVHILFDLLQRMSLVGGMFRNRMTGVSFVL